MLQPNNLRNRYRRYREARNAYRFTYLTFRQWATGWGQRREAYSAEPHHLNCEVKLTRSRP